MANSTDTRDIHTPLLYLSLGTTALIRPLVSGYIDAFHASRAGIQGFRLCRVLKDVFGGRISHSPARGSHALAIKSLLELVMRLLPACEAASFGSSLPAVAGGALKYLDGVISVSAKEIY